MLIKNEGLSRLFWYFTLFDTNSITVCRSYYTSINDI